jgi:DNA-binding CsgD family transcriptional regulator
MDAPALLEKGWAELIKDNDTTALRYFNEAYLISKAKADHENSANALLDMGICSYGSSLTFGLHYCMMAMKEFQKLEKSHPANALTGRSKCLQLISTIKNRQGKFRESIDLSMEALAGFPKSNDTTGYAGLIYNKLGEDYHSMNQIDSSRYFHRLALEERIRTNNTTYLPSSYINVATIEMEDGHAEKSLLYFQRALFIAASTGNRQSQVSAWIGLGKWNVKFHQNFTKAEENFLNAKSISEKLSDKSFYISSLDQLLALKKQKSDLQGALLYSELIRQMKDSLSSWEKDRITRNLEIQFDIAEKDRQLNAAQEEKNIATLTNYILWGTILFLIMIATGIILFLKKINKRDRLLMQTRVQLLKAEEEQKKLKEQQLRNELEYKESQLSAMAVQMMQKNELLVELKERIGQINPAAEDNQLNKIITKGLNHDKEWIDFNTYFESINKNFYSRLKSAYPEISPNDLKICALIKLNLSIKEMSAILNISPDSVKTARYRLRKKLQLNTEDNLTDFILSLN